MEEFPNPQNSYLKAKDFHNNELTVIFKGWERKANEDLVKDGKVSMSWKDRLDYCLKYSYPEIAKDKAGEPILNLQGEPMRNKNFLPQYPKGYSIVYKFDIGTLESGSAPLFDQFCRVKPRIDEKLVLLRTGETTLETKWSLCRASERHLNEVPEIQVGERTFTAEELKADESTPF